uniref:DNA-directed DNA polymerase n=1 Tax=Panagrolaimus sp. ES5 TaxID=591445 RepID=A0AC34F4R3_9BILA
MEIYEVNHYERWSTPGGKDDLFGKYVNTFIALKCQASGYPCPEDEREAYVADYMAKENVKLNPADIEFNPGKRAVAKLMANSLWGKLAQRSNLSEVKITKTVADFHKVMNDPEHEILDFCHINEHTDRIVIRKKEEFQTSSKATCVPVACFVTAHARLKLYSYLEQVKAEHRIYCDTDSLIYIHKFGTIPVKEGIFLGQMGREYLEYRIIEIIVAGPKNYALLMVDKDGNIKVVIKIRGFPLTYSASQLLTFEKMKEKIFQQFRYPSSKPDPINVDYINIKRNKEAELKNVPMVKQWIPVMKKGPVKKDFIVEPWGYIAKVTFL